MNVPDLFSRSPYMSGAAVHVYLYEEPVTFKHTFVSVAYYCNTNFEASTPTVAFADLHIQGILLRKV